MSVAALTSAKTPAAQQMLVFGYYVELRDLWIFTGNSPYNLKNMWLWRDPVELRKIIPISDPVLKSLRKKWCKSSNYMQQTPQRSFRLWRCGGSSRGSSQVAEEGTGVAVEWWVDVKSFVYWNKNFSPKSIFLCLLAKWSLDFTLYPLNESMRNISSLQIMTFFFSSWRECSVIANTDGTAVLIYLHLVFLADQKLVHNSHLS